VGLSLAHEVTLSGYGGPIVLSGTGGNSAVTLSAEGYSGVVWYVDGEEIGAGDGSITLNTADYDARPHSLTFRGVRDGVPYAKLIPFTVTAALTAALPGGDIALDLEGCTGASIAYALSGSAEEQQAIRERFTALTLPASVATIGGGVKAGTVIKSALGGFSRLRQVSGGGVTAIEDNGFRDCAALEGVSFPALAMAGKEGFSGCGSLRAVDFPRATSFGSSAFSGCAALETGRFPGAEFFGAAAFTGCTALGSLVLGDSPPTVALIFNGLAGQAITITVPAGSKAAYEAAYTPAPWGGNVTVTFVEG
jgi:hypothetical protein